MSTTAWLVVALGAVALGIGAYVASLFVRRRSLERRLKDLGSRNHERTK